MKIFLDWIAKKMPTSWWRLTDEEADRLNPPDLDALVDEASGDYYRQVCLDQEWLEMGQCPRPRNEREWFLHNLFMGWMMRYPFWKVVFYSLINAGTCRSLEINLREDLERIARGEEPIYLILQPNPDKE